MNSLGDNLSKINTEDSNNLWLAILHDAFKSLLKFIGLGFGGAIGCYFLVRQWLEKDWQAFALSIGIFIIYVFTAICVIALKYAVSERDHRISLANELAELQKVKEAIITELRSSGLYVQNDVRVINELQVDGTWLSDSIIEIEIVGTGELGIISHWNKEALSRNSIFRDYEAEAVVLQIPSGHKWRSEVIPKSSTMGIRSFPNYIEIQFYIDPPLRRGEKVRYRYTQKYKGTVALSSTELEKVIKSRRFFRDLLKEIRFYSILSSTNRFYRSILFHDGTLISNIEVIVVYRDALDKEETERAGRHFTVVSQANQQLFACLDIPQPKTDYMYGIMWSLTK